MGIEAGGKNAIIPADDITKAWVDARNAGNRPYEIFHPDKDANYFSKHTYDLKNLEPVVAMPHSPDNKELAKIAGKLKLIEHTLVLVREGKLKILLQQQEFYKIIKSLYLLS